MRVLTAIAVIFGSALLIGLTVYLGFGSVMQAIVESRWGTLLVVIARAVALAAAGIGWWLLLAPARARLVTFIGLRFLRDAINALVPFAGVGGDIVGARLLGRFGVAANVAYASVLIDIFIQVFCLLIFVIAGLLLVLDVDDAHQLTSMTLIMLAVALPAIAGFFLALNFGAFDSVLRKLVTLGEQRRWPVLNNVADLGGRLQAIWGNHRGLSASFAVHLAAIFFGASEVWIALAFMNHAVSLTEAIAIESLGQGSRAAAFILPGGLGVQDAALVGVCAVFGIPAEVALAMALIKRIPDLILGVPALVGWQALEGKRLFTRGK